MVLRILFFGILFSITSCSENSSDKVNISTEEIIKPFTAADAKDLFLSKCTVCHGSDGKLGASQAKDLSTSKLSDEEILDRIKHGKNAMPPFEGLIPEDQRKMLVSFVKTLRNKP